MELMEAAWIAVRAIFFSILGIIGVVVLFVVVDIIGIVRERRRKPIDFDAN